jgi:hypothetical protein
MIAIVSGKVLAVFERNRWIREREEIVVVEKKGRRRRRRRKKENTLLVSNILPMR